MSAHALGERYHCDWRVIALCRSGLATLFALLLCWQGRARLVLFRPPILWVRSFAGSLSLCCTFYALSQAHLHASEVLVLTNMFPIWVALLSWPLAGEVPNGSTWLSAFVGVIGVWLIEQPLGEGGHLAMFLALTASLGSAIAMLGLHRLQGIDARAIVVHFSAVSTLFVVGMLILGPTPPLAQLVPEHNAPWLLLVVGVTATVGQVFLTRAFAAGPPSKVSVVALSQVVFVLILEQFVDPRPLNGKAFLGMVLVMAPTAWVLWRSRRKISMVDAAEPFEAGKVVVTKETVMTAGEIVGGEKE
jgi:drug/metabolite transporter (DMT)-like permease